MMDFDEFLIILNHKNYELSKHIRERMKNRKDFDTTEEIKIEMESTLFILKELNAISGIINNAQPRNDNESMLQKKEAVMIFDQISRMEIYYNRLKDCYEIEKQLESYSRKEPKEIEVLRTLILIVYTIVFLIVLLNIFAL